MQNKITHNKSKLKILIRAANWVGDAIMTTPIIRAIRKNYPHAHITLLAKPWVIPVFDNNPYIDDIMFYENSTRHTKGFGTLRLARDIRKKKFDMAILMQNAFEAALITFLGGVPVRIGYNTDGRTLLLNPSIKLDKRLKKVHLIDYYRGILKGAGLVDDGRKLDLFISDKDRKDADDIIASLYKNIDWQPTCRDARPCVSTISSPIIGINPGATGGTAKRWFPQRYAELANRLAQRFNTKILIFGGQADKELGEQIKELAQSFNGSSQTSNSSSNNLNDKQKSQFDGSVCVNLAGKTTLRQAFTLIEKCDLFITNDSGLMHAAAALETRQIAIIGSTDHIATAPSSPNSVIIRVPVSCSPCLKVDCPKKESYLDYHTCMDKISVDMVMEKCESVLESIS
ncbi:MAG: glycosyltransferase family 9 protein [Desulfamplus sp.]|nr:glycosyltransferase family 9 protein [Desulfamplus sp.]